MYCNFLPFDYTSEANQLFSEDKLKFDSWDIELYSII